MYSGVNIDEIVKRVKIEAQVSTNKQLADILEVSSSNFSNMKRRGTLLTPLIEWAINHRVNLSWLVYGEEKKEVAPKPRKPAALFEEIAQLQEWLSEITAVEPERRNWFKMEIVDKFPAFKEWLGEREAAKKEQQKAA